MDGERTESGLVLVLLALTILSICAICALAIDGWQLLLTARDAQQAADSAALAGVEVLRMEQGNLTDCAVGANPTLCFYPKSSLSWRNIKRAVAAVISGARIIGLNSTAQQSLAAERFRFNDPTGLPTFNDDLAYSTDTGSAGNLKVKVSRGVQCYNSRNELLFFSLEGIPSTWCRVNAVHVEVTISNSSGIFLGALGINKGQDVKASGIATRQPPEAMLPDLPQLNICGNDQCALLGNLNEVRGTFSPFAC